MAIIKSAPNFNDTENPTITYSLAGLVNPSYGYLKSVEVGIFPDKEDGSALPMPESEKLAFAKFRSVSVNSYTYKFNLTDTERKALMDACKHTPMAVRFYLRYYSVLTDGSGGTVYEGWNYTWETRYFHLVSTAPTVTGTVVDINEETIALTGDSNKLIKYHSTAKATASATAHDAVIDLDMFTVRNNNTVRFGQEGEFENVESKVFTFSAQDSRGVVGSCDVVADMIEYIRPTCKISNNRPDAVGNMSLMCSGVFFNGSFGAKYNSISVMYRYAITGEGLSGDWTNMEVTTNGNLYYAIANFTIPNFSQQKYYSFEIVVVDSLEYVTETSSGLKSMPIFHWGENDFAFEVPVTFNAGITGMPELEYGIWEPRLELITSYSQRSGWYSKIGNVVTVGFYIKADCYSGVEYTDIAIYGLPYTPLNAAAGGGMCSGAYVSGGFNFQCFVAEEDGTITTRVQSCNNTTATNLSTSASGCKFRSGGGQMTLSGTITYITWD